MAYPTTATLVAASNVPELARLTVAQQDAYRDLAIIAVEDFTGQKFEPLVGDVTVDGQGGRELWLDRRVEVLTGISIGGAPLDISDVRISENRDRLIFRGSVGNYAVRAMRDEIDTRTFRAGKDVTLTGTFGWSEPPSAVVQALRLDMEEQALADANGLSGTLVSMRRLGVRDVAQGNLRASLGDGIPVSPRIAQLLQRYVWLGPAGHVV